MSPQDTLALEASWRMKEIYDIQFIFPEYLLTEGRIFI